MMELPPTTIMATPIASKNILARFRPLILTGVVAVIIAEIVALSPSSIEEAHDLSAPIDPETLIPKAQKTLASGIPTGRVPEYTVERFNYISTHESTKEWNLMADTAFLYNKEKIVHAMQVKAYLYDPDGKITYVTGQEAKYLLSAKKTAAQGAPGVQGAQGTQGAQGERDLEVFGNVKTVFPDGFEVQSDYMKYTPEGRVVEIPTQYEAKGIGKDENGQLLTFNSKGMTYRMGQAKIALHEHVKVTVDKKELANSTASAKQKAKDNNHTTIESDHCMIDRENKIADFTMDQLRPLTERYVIINQPTMISKGRRGELNYGDRGKDSSSKLLHYMVLYDDVLLRELGGTMKYATSGRADFDGTKDLVILTEYPQVYEGKDTAAGDRIILHRDTDVVEVENSNSFSQGTEN